MKKIRNMLVTVLVSVLMVALLLAGCSASDLKDGYIMEGVSVAGVNIGGMTKEDALRAVQMAVSNTYSTTPMVVQVLNDTFTLAPEATGVSLNPEAAVELAYGVGRDLSKVEYQALKLQAMTTGIDTDISSCLSINRETLRTLLASQCAGYTDSALEQSGYEVVGELPDLAAEALPEELQTLVISTGTPQFHLDLDVLCDQVMDAYSNREFQVEYECQVTLPDEIDLDTIYAELASEPVEPVMDEETFEVSDHAYGYSFDLEAAKAMLAEADYGETLEIPFFATAPEKTKEEVASVLFRDVLAKASADSFSTYNRATNLRLACEALNGTILLPGESLSYNEALGERTPERGWKPAGTYVGGETVDTYGGGICQPSSVLYYCTLLADLKIVHRACHQYISSYVDPGMDATVYWGGVDFIFANNTEYPIRIDAKADGGYVEIALVGTDTKDYYVKMEYSILGVWNWEEEFVEIPEDNNPKGYKDGEVISSPYTGYRVNTYKCRYSKADDSLIERVFEAESIYSSRNKKIVKIISNKTEEPTPDPSEPTPDPSEPAPDPSEPTPDPSEPAPDPSVPETEPTTPETEPTNPGGDSSE